MSDNAFAYAVFLLLTFVLAVGSIIEDRRTK
jgi:hypothetical protein